MQLIKYGAAMSFAFKEEMNELGIFCHCCRAANLWVITLSRLSIIEGADIMHEPHGSDTGGSNPSGPMKSAPLPIMHETRSVMTRCRLTSVYQQKHMYLVTP